MLFADSVLRERALTAVFFSSLALAAAFFGAAFAAGCFASSCAAGLFAAGFFGAFAFFFSTPLTTRTASSSSDTERLTKGTASLCLK